MNIHEYQAKKLLKKYKIKIPNGAIAYTPSEAVNRAQKISKTGPFVLKAQIYSGARAHGHFIKNGTKNLSGICFVSNIEDVFKISEKMISNTLVTSQTNKKGKLVSKIYVEEFCIAKRTFYLSFVINRIKACITLLVSGVTDNIVDLAKNTPKSILRIHFNLNQRIQKKDTLQILKFLKLNEKYHKNLTAFIQNLYKAFLSLDATMLEINPVGLTKDDDFIALDAKISFDNNALFRHPDVVLMHDDYEVDENVLQAAKCGFKYHKFEKGTIGLIVNGDGPALAARDYLEKLGYQTACYLDIKGGVDEDKIAQSLKILMTNPMVEGILINILGGFLRCNLVADGIVAVSKEIGFNMPLVARFEGTNKQMAQEILKENNFDFLTSDNLQDAAEKLIKAMKENE